MCAAQFPWGREILRWSPEKWGRCGSRECYAEREGEGEGKNRVEVDQQSVLKLCEDQGAEPIRWNDTGVTASSLVLETESPE